MNKHNETGNNTTYGLVKEYIHKYGIEKTRLTVYSGDLNAKAVSMASFIDSRMERETIRKCLGGYNEN